MSYLIITLHVFHDQYCYKGRHYFLRFSLLPMVLEELRFRPPTFIWVSLCIAALLFFSDVFGSFKHNLQTSILPKYPEHTPDGRSMKGYLVKTEGCRIPDMNPYDLSVKKFIFNEDAVKCNQGVPALFASNLSSIFRINESLSAYNISNVTSLRCCYTPFWRINPGKNGRDTKTKFSSKCVNFTDFVQVKEEFVMVECFNNNLSMYKDYFSFVPLKKKKKKTVRKKYNVLIIGLDSISRLNFYRQMPETKSVLENLKAVELLGYNKVGDNTFPNLIPILTGLSEEELKSRCWANTSVHFDDCPFIWKKFKQSGYFTAFAEDSTWMGIFTYQKNGFIKQPTDYFWSPFNFVSEKQIGNQHRMNVQQCIGSKEAYITLLEYVEKFTERMQKSKSTYFGFFWESSLSHDYLNKPKLGDKSFSKLLARLKTKEILNDTVLIFLSDHGIRWGAIRSTYQGNIEERLPFLYVYLPQEFKDRFSLAHSNLVRNARRLTTPFDIHETLEDLVNVNALSSEDFINHSKSNRSFSLFNFIPTNRTCESASIASHWCTCQDSAEISVNDSTVIEAAQYAVQYINNLLNGTECLNLKIDEVLFARKHSHSNLSKKDHFEDFTVTLRTMPGGALFETTVRKKYLESSYSLDVMGTISRINLYGNQSACTTDFHLKLYCYCR